MTQIELGVGEFNEGAIAFYEKLGYETAYRKMVKDSIARPANKFCKETFTNFENYDFRSRLHETKKDCAKIHQYEVVGWARAKKSNLFAV